MKKVTRHLLAGAGIILLILSILMMAGVVHAAEPVETITNEKIGHIVLSDVELNDLTYSDLAKYKWNTSVFTQYIYHNYTETLNESGLTITEQGGESEYYLAVPVAAVYGKSGVHYIVNLSMTDTGSSGEMDIFIGSGPGSVTEVYNIKIALLQTRIYPAFTVNNSLYSAITYPANIDIYVNPFNKTYILTVDGQQIYKNTSYSAMFTSPYVPPPPTILKFHMANPSSTSSVRFTLRYVKTIVDRYIITPMPIKFIAPGFDHPGDTTYADNLMNLTAKYGGKATIFYDDGYNTGPTKYWISREWELGIHFSKELDTLTEAQAEATIDNEYNNITQKFPGHTPHMWCSLGNHDNLTHRDYAYPKYSILRRNDAGFDTDYPGYEAFNDRYQQIIHGIEIGAVSYFYTHGNSSALPPTAYGITEENYTKILETAKQHGYYILPWYEAYMITRNTHEFWATDIQRGDGYLKFTAHTNGYKAWVDVNYTPTNNTVVKDLTTGKYINWTKGSVAFWVEDGHEYEILEQPPAPAGAPESVQWNVTPWNVLLMFVGFVMVAASARRW